MHKLHYITVWFCVSQSGDGSTALHLAAYQGAVSLVELLLLNGAQADIRDKDGRLPLHWATHPSSIKCINTILKVCISLL